MPCSVTGNSLLHDIGHSFLWANSQQGAAGIAVARGKWWWVTGVLRNKMGQNNFDLVSDLWFMSTCYHSPTFTTTLGIWHCFVIWWPILQPWVQKRRQFPNPRTPIYLNYFCMCNKKGGNINCRTIEKMNIFSRTQRFSWVYWMKDTM